MRERAGKRSDDIDAGKVSTHNIPPCDSSRPSPSCVSPARPSPFSVHFGPMSVAAADRPPETGPRARCSPMSSYGSGRARPAARAPPPAPGPNARAHVARPPVALPPAPSACGTRRRAGWRGRRPRRGGAGLVRRPGAGKGRASSAWQCPPPPPTHTRTPSQHPKPGAPYALQIRLGPLNKATRL